MKRRDFLPAYECQLAHRLEGFSFDCQLSVLLHFVILGAQGILLKSGKVQLQTKLK